MPARSCSKWSGRSAAAGASSSRCAARSASCSPGSRAILAIAYALEALKFTPAAIFWFRIVTGAGPRRRRRLVLRAAAVAQGHRRTGRAVSRGARADARFDDPERDGSVRAAGDWSPELIDRLVENAIERVHEIQEGERIEREPMRAMPGWRGVAWRDRALHVRTGVPPPHVVGDLRRVARRRSRGAVSHRGEAGRRDGRQGRRSDDQRHALGLRRGGSGDPDPQGDRRARSSACR